MFDRVYLALRRALYTRGWHLDPYTVMEVATLVERYIVNCDESSREGAVRLLSSAMSKWDEGEHRGEAIDVIEEVVGEFGNGCEENHRLRGK